MGDDPDGDSTDTELVGLCVIPEWLSVTNFDLSIILVNGLIDVSVFFLVVILIARVGKQQRVLEMRVRTLEGILPVCSFCKKIRNEDEKWEPMEVFICRNSEAQFSHSVCPDCGEQHYGEFYEQPVKTPEPNAISGQSGAQDSRRSLFKPARGVLQ